MNATLKNGKIAVIRPATEEDAEGVIAVLQHADAETDFLVREQGEFSYDIPREREFLKRANGEGNVFLVVEYEGGIVAVCNVFSNRARRLRHRAELSLVVGLKEHWGLGIGSAVMRAAETWAKEHGFEQLELSVVRENARAVSLYEKFGFKPYGTLPHAMKYADGSYVDFVMMIKNL